jgi:NADH-quinone oxidoreductase subunit G
VREGDRVEVGVNGTRVEGPVRLRAAVPGGSVFLAEGTHDQPANALTEPLVEIRRVGAEPLEPSALAAQVQPAAEGLTEAPASAPQAIPPVAPDTTTRGGSEG